MRIERKTFVDIEQFKSPKYFKHTPWDGGGSHTDYKRNIIILDYRFTNLNFPYTIKFNKKHGGFELVSEDDFERLTLFFEMMNEQRDQHSTG